VIAPLVLSLAMPFAAATDAPEVIGRSVQDRPIVAQRFGPDDARLTVLVVGCIHGNECAGLPVLERLRRRPPPGVELWLISTVNPDGRALNTRGNAHGVDLNRNFPAGWRRIPRSSRYHSGARPESEPETRAVVRFLRRERPQLSIWFHQPEVNVRDPDGSPAARVYARLVGLPFRPLASPPGTATRWQKRADPDAEAFVVELPWGPLPPADAARHGRAVRLVIKHRA
jgi:murein peptide amidase A